MSATCALRATPRTFVLSLLLAGLGSGVAVAHVAPKLALQLPASPGAAPVNRSALEPAAPVTQLENENASLKQRIEALEGEIPKFAEKNRILGSAVQTLTEANTNAIARINTLDAESLKLQADLSQLQSQLAKMQMNAPRSIDTRRSFSGPSAGPPQPAPQPPPATTGELVLVNAYPTPMSVVVEGQFYFLQPGESRRLTRSAGPFTFSVPGVQGEASRTLIAGESYTIRVYAR